MLSIRKAIDSLKSSGGFVSDKSYMEYLADKYDIKYHRNTLAQARRVNGNTITHAMLKDAVDQLDKINDKG